MSALRENFQVVLFKPPASLITGMVINRISAVGEGKILLSLCYVGMFELGIVLQDEYFYFFDPVCGSIKTLRQ